MRWNYAKLKNDIRLDTICIREMKAKQRKALQPNWNHGLDDWTLAKLKRYATIRCCIAAHLNHKIHLSNYKPKKETALRPMTPLEQFELIKGQLKDYAIQEQVQEQQMAAG